MRGATLDLYDLAGLEASLAGTVFADKLHFSPATDSTNTDALAGRTQRGAEWISFFSR